MLRNALRQATVDEYLAFERTSEEKHEYWNGEIFAMTGASRQHNRIAWNLVIALGPQLEQSGCEGYVGDMRVMIEESGLFTYPDLVVVCGEPSFLVDQQPDTLLNPTLIAEILSPSTADYDRGSKFAHYRRLDSLKSYLLLAQDRVHVERFERQNDGTWVLSETDDPGAKLALPAVGVQLEINRLYAGVEILAS